MGFSLNAIKLEHEMIFEFNNYINLLSKSYNISVNLVLQVKYYMLKYI